MAAIDIIKSMSNGELLKYYEYCMVRAYERLRHRGVNYHPSYEHCSVYLGEHQIYNLHYPNEMFLLNEMWDRFMNGTFLEQCWWQSKNPWKTKISLPFKREEPEPIKTIEIQPKKVKETIDYNNEKFEFLASGTKRRTFLSPCKTYVIKIPKEPYTLGLLENKTEAEIYQANPFSIYAKCELIENGWLKMEYVEPKYFTKDDDYPEWTLGIAEHQVGYNLKGDLVAYDYGSEI
jgi:hypothetical protein